MKKILILLLSVLCAVCLVVGCGKTTEGKDSASFDSSKTASESLKTSDSSKSQSNSTSKSNSESQLSSQSASQLSSQSSSQSNSTELDPEDYLEFSLNGDNSSYIAKQKTGCEVKNVKIPTEYNGLPIVSIGNEAFRNNCFIETVEIPEGVISINGYAFSGCYSLREVSIPNSMEWIGKSAFNDCIALETVKIKSLEKWCNIDFSEDIYSTYKYLSNPLAYAKNLLENGKNSNALKIDCPTLEIKPYAFYYFCYLESADLNVKAIGESAFFNCNVLSKLTLGESVETIGNDAFANCVKIDEVKIPSKVVTLGDRAFKNCVSMTKLDLGSVQTIGENTFDTCCLLAEIDFGDSLQTIGKSAFTKCLMLMELNIPSTVTTIKSAAFGGCQFLMFIRFESGLQTIEDYAFTGCEKLYEIVNLSSLTIKCGLETNGEVAKYALYVYDSADAKSLLKVDENGFLVLSDSTNDNYKVVSYFGDDFDLILPNDVDGHKYTINQKAFKGFPINSVKIPANCTEIGDEAFYGTTLKSVEIAEGVKKIGKLCFGNSDYLQSLTIPNSVVEIGSAIVSDCNSLTDLTVPFLGATVDCVNENSIYYLSSTKIPLQNVVIKSGTFVASKAFFDYESLKTVTLPDTIKRIEGSAFRRCEGLESFTIGENVELIGKGAFEDCDALTKVYFEDETYWKYAENAEAVNGDLLEIGTPEQNAENIKNYSVWATFKKYNTVN